MIFIAALFNMQLSRTPTVVSPLTKSRKERYIQFNVTFKESNSLPLM